MLTFPPPFRRRPTFVSFLRTNLISTRFTLSLEGLPKACATRINVPIVRFRGSFSIAEIFAALISTHNHDPVLFTDSFSILNPCSASPSRFQTSSSGFSPRKARISLAPPWKLSLSKLTALARSPPPCCVGAGLQTRMQVDAFLKDHGVELEYTLEDLERDRETHRQLGL